MDTFAVTGGAGLAGTATVTGAKNSALKLMAAALLAEGTSTIHAVPDIADVQIMGEVLRRLGCAVQLEAGTARIGVPPPTGWWAPRPDWTSRASGPPRIC